MIQSYKLVHASAHASSDKSQAELEKERARESPPIEPLNVHKLNGPISRSIREIHPAKLHMAAVQRMHYSTFQRRTCHTRNESVFSERRIKTKVHIKRVFRSSVKE